MIRHMYTVICQRTIVDSETNNSTLVDVIEQLAFSAVDPEVQAGPVKGLTAYVCVLWIRGPENRPERGSGRVRLLSPSGEELLSVAHDIDLSVHRRARTIGMMPGFPVKKGERGEYRFVTEIMQPGSDDFVEVHRYPIDVSFAEKDSD